METARYGNRALEVQRPPGAETATKRGRASQYNSDAVRIVALVWTILLVLALTVPDTGDGRMPAKATTTAVIVGAVLYAMLVRRRILRGEAGPPAVDSAEAPR
jgi:hypothetical protein